MKRPSERSWQKQKAAAVAEKEEERHFAGLPSVPDVRNIAEKGEGSGSSGACVTC